MKKDSDFILQVEREALPHIISANRDDLIHDPISAFSKTSVTLV
jgi:hypothetical protein